jgi:hypothetical protein
MVLVVVGLDLRLKIVARITAPNTPISTKEKT